MLQFEETRRKSELVERPQGLPGEEDLTGRRLNGGEEEDSIVGPSNSHIFIPAC